MAPGHCDVSEASPPTLIPSRGHPNLQWECVRKGQGSPDEVRGGVKHRGRPHRQSPLAGEERSGCKTRALQRQHRCNAVHHHPRVATSTAPVHRFSGFLLLSHCLSAPGLFFYPHFRARRDSSVSRSGPLAFGFPPSPTLGGVGSAKHPVLSSLKPPSLAVCPQSHEVTRQRP